MKAFVVPVLLIGLAVLTITQVEAKCHAAKFQKELERYGQYILEDKCYAFVNGTWTDYRLTKQYCSFHGGVLAMPKTKAINDFLVSKQGEFGSSKSFWIGLSITKNGKVGDKNQYVWSDGSPLQTATDFHKLSAKELVSSEGNEGNGVILNLGTGKWTVINPEERRKAGKTRNHNYICEFVHIM